MSARRSSPSSRHWRTLLTAVGLTASLTLSACWTEEVPTKPGMVDLDGDGIADADQVQPDDGQTAGGDIDLDGPGSGVGGEDTTDSDAGGDGAATDAIKASTDPATSGTKPASTSPKTSGSSTSSSSNRTGSTTSTTGSSARTGSRTSTSGTTNRTGSSTSTSGTTNRTGSTSGTSTRTGTTGGTTNRTGTTKSASTDGGTPKTPTADTSVGDATSRGTGSNRTGSSTADTSTTAKSAASNDAVSMGMELPATDDWTPPPGASRFTGADWQRLREDRVVTVMNEPGPGTDPGCYPRDVLPMAQKGKLTKDQVSCVQKSLSQAEYDADKARLSLVLIANAHARGESDNWEWLVARHLETIDEENPGLAYRYALHLYDQGDASYPNSYHWAGVALGQRAAWTGDVYHERVTRLYKLRAALSQAQWRKAEAGFAGDPSEDNRDRVLEWRDLTRQAALDWYSYANETGMDAKTPYALCEIASIQKGCEGASN